MDERLTPASLTLAGASRPRKAQPRRAAFSAFHTHRAGSTLQQAELGRKLERSLETGLYCSYRP
jgi:hypothetical protein